MRFILLGSAKTIGNWRCFPSFWSNLFPLLKYNRLDVIQLGPDARSTDMEIAYSTSTVRTPAFHGPDARSSDMEIVSWRLTIWTATPLVWTRECLIWKLLAAVMRPSGRQCLTIQTQLSNRKDFQRKSRKFYCTVVRPDGSGSPSGRRPYILQQSPIWTLSL